MPEIIISCYREGQEEMISQLIAKVYAEFVAPDYPEEGNRFFSGWIEPTAIASRQKSGQKLWVAFADGQPAGMIELRDSNWVSLLFVDKAFMGQGIARKLLKTAMDFSLEQDQTLKSFFVHASPFSIPVNQKLGFVATGTLQEEHGIKYLPMELIIRD